MYEKYNETQKLLYQKHPYEWIDGEAKYDSSPAELIFLTKDQKEKRKNMSYVEIFELFFSNELKDYIIDCTKENDYELSRDQFNGFTGILVTSNFNPRKSKRHYWSKNDLLHQDRVALVMSRNTFLSIKKNIKFYKNCEKNESDKIWKEKTCVILLRKIFYNSVIFLPTCQ